MSHCAFSLGLKDWQLIGRRNFVFNYSESAYPVSTILPSAVRLACFA